MLCSVHLLGTVGSYHASPSGPIGARLDCLTVSVFFSLLLQASVTVKNSGGAISNDRMVAPSHFAASQSLFSLVSYCRPLSLSKIVVALYQMIVWYRGAGKARFNVATPTYATVTCTAYVLLYNLLTKSI